MWKWRQRLKLCSHKPRNAKDFQKPPKRLKGQGRILVQIHWRKHLRPVRKHNPLLHGNKDFSTAETAFVGLLRKSLQLSVEGQIDLKIAI